MTDSADPPKDRADDDDKPKRPHRSSPEATTSASGMRMAQAGGLAHRRGPHACSSCGRSLGSGVRFCVACGAVSSFYDHDLATDVRYEIPSQHAELRIHVGTGHFEGHIHRARVWAVVGVIVLIVTLASFAIYLIY
jgi:hypothetical protein